MRKLIPAIRTARIQVVIVPHHRWRDRKFTKDTYGSSIPPFIR
jgi:hypothetical protein